MLNFIREKLGNIYFSIGSFMETNCGKFKY